MTGDNVAPLCATGPDRRSPRCGRLPDALRRTRLELYHSDLSVCAAKERIGLDENSLAWRSIHVNLRAGDAPAYLQLNPNAVVPALLQDGLVVIESAVICEYLDLDDACPDPAVKPAAGESPP
ncbi:MAG: glutathione S-transferase N-terminal domain-containing protein [Hyphomicrobiales bacterium]|nr:glutathione S-transferase N-terminal domain-containing protein [Hyphomicrobiales bacterium]